MEPLLPLFPLDVVLFPEMFLPLHIFEERYKSMIGECIQEKAPFGVVYAHDETIELIGCMFVHPRLVNGKRLAPADSRACRTSFPGMRSAPYGFQPALTQPRVGDRLPRLAHGFRESARSSARAM